MTRDALSGPLSIQRVGPPPARLETLVEDAERGLGLVAVRDLIYVPGLLRTTSDLPSPEWPKFRDTLPPEPIDVASALAFFEAVPVEILKSSNWHLLQHQCGGVSCLQETMIAIPLDPIPEMQAAFMRLATSYWGTDLGRGPPRLSELLAYRAFLLDLGLDCDTSYTQLREGIYPVDSSENALQRVTFNPPDVATLVIDRPFLSTICFLAPNSD